MDEKMVYGLSHTKWKKKGELDLEKSLSLELSMFTCKQSWLYFVSGLIIIFIVYSIWNGDKCESFVYAIFFFSAFFCILGFKEKNVTQIGVPADT